MSAHAKYVIAALAAAALAHAAIVLAIPLLLMNVAMERIGGGGFNHWRTAPRVTETSRTIVRPSPDFAYSACAYDLAAGPIVIRTAPWGEYWSLSLYADNSDNFFVVGDREARAGADILLARPGDAVDSGENVVRSPSRRGIALIRRLAPTQVLYDAAVRVAEDDVCAAMATLARARD